MMRMRIVVRYWLGAFVICLLTGCGPKLVPVSGKVTVDGAPVTSGKVRYIPDKTKGNEEPVACTGRIINDQGDYEVYTTNMIKGADGGKGVPPGWYKVVIDGKVSSVYSNEEKTPLSIEVVAKPASGAYDLKLSN